MLLFPDRSTTSAEALVALAVRGGINDPTALCVLQAVHDSAAGPWAFHHPAPQHSRRPFLSGMVQEPEYRYLLGTLQSELLGEYLELDACICGEPMRLRGYVISDEYEASAWLSVKPSYYQNEERPPLLRALAGMVLLNVSQEMRRSFMEQYPATSLLNAVKQTYRKRRYLRHPPAYLHWLLKTSTDLPTAV